MTGELAQQSALYAFDAAWAVGRPGPLAGADEAGRGALAGPLVAAAAVLGEAHIPEVNDSKTLRAGRRDRIFEQVLGRASALSTVFLPAWWIDRYGLGHANREALRRSLALVDPHAGCSLADGNLRLGEGIYSLPAADAQSAAVAAASVLAKVLRDHAMDALAAAHAGYGFERNRGYGTPEHRLALTELGPCRVHRLSYAGVGP